MIEQAITLVGHWLAWLFAFVLGLFGLIEAAIGRLMDQLHIPPGLQTIILLLLTILLIVAAIRVFGGLFRILLLIFLILLLAHAILPHAPTRRAAVTHRLGISAVSLRADPIELPTQ